MKKIWSLASIALLLAACSGSPKTGGDKSDSGSHGSSGAADTSMKAGTPTGTSAQSSGTSDTSKPKVADTSKYKKH